jgi:hypothetical protein
MSHACSATDPPSSDQAVITSATAFCFVRQPGSHETEHETIAWLAPSKHQRQLGQAAEMYL